MSTHERSDGGSLEPETVARIEEIVEEKISEKIVEMSQVKPSASTGPVSDPGSTDGQVEGPGSVQPN